MLRIVFILAILILVASAWLSWRRRRAQADVARARAEYSRLRPKLQEDFRAAADVSGKPRGLRWKSTDFQDAILLARDRASGELVGLVDTSIAFEAVEGSQMEGVEAVGNLRAGTAILIWTGHEWTTAGRAVFNLDPRQTLVHYGKQLAAIEP